MIRLFRKMFLITHSFILITQIIFAISEPIDKGFDVGYVSKNELGEYTVFNPGKYRYAVNLDIQSIEIKQKPKEVIYEVHSLCGGSLIRKRIVLTAAHCLSEDNIEKITAWVGIVETELEKGKGQKLPVKGFTIHEEYIRRRGNLLFKNDIAILFLLKPAELNDYVQLAQLPPKNFVAAERQGLIIGWGTLSCGTKKSMLQEAVTRAISQAECFQYYKPLVIWEGEICVLSDDRMKTSTHGDSGGPLIIDDYVVGVSSFGTDVETSNKEGSSKACDPTVPAVYTYVPKYLDWIEKTIRAGPRTVITGAPLLPPRGASVQPPREPPRMRRTNVRGMPQAGLKSSSKNRNQRKPTSLTSSTKNKTQRKRAK